MRPDPAERHHQAEGVYQADPAERHDQAEVAYQAERHAWTETAFRAESLDRTKRPRRVHRTDWLALLCGLLFVGIGVRYVTGSSPDPLIMLPALLVGLGFAGFVAIIARVFRRS